MIPFDKSKFEIKIIKLIAVTSAVGGSFRHIVNGKEVREPLPFAVARKLTKRYGARLLNPIEAFAVMYDGKYICIDSYIKFDEDREGVLPDTPFIHDIRGSIEAMVDDKWSFDGRFIFKLHNVDPKDQTFLTHSGMLRSCPATCIDLQGIRGQDSEDEDSVTDVVDDRDCVIAYAPNGQVMVSPPIWSNMSQIRSNVESLHKATNVNSTYYQMDEISDKYQLSIDFVINVAKVIGYNFGYAHVAPLRIPQLMVSLNCVNLARIDKSARSRLDSGFSVLEGVLFLIGYLNKTTDLYVYQDIKQLLKHTVGRWTHDRSDNDVNEELVDVFSQIEMIDHHELVATIHKQDENVA